MPGLSAVTNSFLILIQDTITLLYGTNKQKGKETGLQACWSVQAFESGVNLGQLRPPSHDSLPKSVPFFFFLSGLECVFAFNHTLMEPLDN